NINRKCWHESFNWVNYSFHKSADTWCGGSDCNAFSTYLFCCFTKEWGVPQNNTFYYSLTGLTFYHLRKITQFLSIARSINRIIKYLNQPLVSGRTSVNPAISVIKPGANRKTPPINIQIPSII